MWVDESQVRYIQNQLLAWFATSGRTFPWRDATDSFTVLVAEKLLQQTAAKPAVVEAFIRITAEFPTPGLLSQAEPVILQDIFRPLGLTYRAEELRRLSYALVEHFQGKVPDRLDELLLLPGVGDYSARAVLCFAFGRDMAVVDVNVARILHRYLGIEEPLPKNPARSKRLLAIAQGLLPHATEQAKNFNWAMLDLGASVCTSRRPTCAACPLRLGCCFGRLVITAMEDKSHASK